MNEPNADLMERFGTQGFYESSLEKRASLPVLLGLLGAAGTLALLKGSSDDQERQALEAQVLASMLRAADARRQAGVHGGLSGRTPALSTAGRAAQQLDDMHEYQKMMSLMKQSSAPMRKEAFGALVGAGAKLLGNVGRTTKSLMPTLKMPTRAIGPKVPGTGALQGAAQAAQAAEAKKPLIGFKGKLLASGAMLGAGIGGYKALGAAKDYMMQPTGGGGRGGPGTLRGGVNEFGYNDVL